MEYNIEEYSKMIKFACEYLDNYVESNVDNTVINKCFANITENQLKAIDLYVLQGMTYTEVGRELNVSITRARDLCARAARKIRWNYLHADDAREISLASDIEFMDLSVRTTNALKRAGINTIKQLMDRLDKLQNVRNLGNLGIQEVKSSLATFGFIEFEIPEEDEITVTFKMSKEKLRPGYNDIVLDYNPNTGVFTFINSL